MISTTGIIPEDLMFRERKRDVMNFLLASAYPSEFKRRLLEGWALTVGLRIRSSDYHLIEASGVDYQDS